jgi:hypothetical protein
MELFIMTKEEKREKRKKDRGIVDFIMIQTHFFKEFQKWIEEMTDPRHLSYTTYTQTDLIYLGILKNVCSVESMRQMEEKFNETVCADTLRLLSGNQKLKEVPHCDTLNYYLELLSPDCLSELRKKMVTSLIRGKQFYSNRLLGRYWRVILDGTGVACFEERHCDNCLYEKRTYKDGRKVTVYYHKVLEAKLILGDKIVVSLGTEFIENERSDVSKQDCETKAAKRLLERIKKEYPRLPICIQGDAMYATEPMMEICRLNGWKYIFSHKETQQRVLADNYNLLSLEDGKQKVQGIGAEKGTAIYCNGIGKMAGKTEIMNVYEYTCKKIIKKQEKTVHFQWITDIELTRRNLEEMVRAGRGRWKIENEGFNNQKNGIYHIQHLNSRNSNAMKNHYLLTQIADILMQLYLAWNPIIKEIKQSIKNTSSRLLESFRRQPVTDEDVHYILRYTTIYLE